MRVPYRLTRMRRLGSHPLCGHIHVLQYYSAVLAVMILHWRSAWERRQEFRQDPFRIRRGVACTAVQALSPQSNGMQ